MNRRTFIGTGVGASLAAAALPVRAQERKLGPLGMQLWTVREMMKNDFEGTLAKVAAIGYQEVEFAGYLDHPPEVIRAVLDRHQLTAPSAHVKYEVVEKSLPATIEAAHTIGHRFIICPSIDESQQRQRGGWQRAAEVFNGAGEACKKAGIQFGYHNHTEEFKPADSLDGKLPYDLLLTATDPSLVKMEMDLCWITAAGGDPIAYFDRYPERFPLVHVKDWTRDGKMADVGSGAIDWKRLFAQSEKAGIQHYFVEHDEPASPLASLQESYTYLRALRY